MCIPDHAKRNAVWNELTALRPQDGEPWFLTGDFNELIDNSEKSGGQVRAEGTFCAFRTFLSTNDLFDIKHYGNFLSWRGKRNSQVVQCRLDRALSKSEWTYLFPSCRSQYLRYEGSDHRPIVTFFDTTKQKVTRIFRYDRRLKDNQEIKEIIKHTWEWHPHLKVEIKLSLCHKAICKLEDDRGIPWFEQDQISNVICNFYKDLFTSSNQDGSQTVHKALTPCITDQVNERLIRDPTPEEVREATFAIHPDKAPSPDGFSASFFQANWEVVGPAVTQEIQMFFRSGSLSPSQNETHVRLIPKTTGAKRVADYRPIALCNVYFKIISKMLSLRLKPVLNLIIS